MLFESFTHRAVNAHLKTLFFSYSFTINPAKEVEEVRLPLTPASTALLTAAFLATGLVVALKIRRGLKTHI